MDIWKGMVEDQRQSIICLSEALTLCASQFAGKSNRPSLLNHWSTKESRGEVHGKPWPLHSSYCLCGPYSVSGLRLVLLLASGAICPEDQLNTTNNQRSQWTHRPLLFLILIISDHDNYLWVMTTCIICNNFIIYIYDTYTLQYTCTCTHVHIHTGGLSGKYPGM